MIGKNVNWHDMDNVYCGGPLLREIASVIHSNDYANPSTGRFTESFNISKSTKTINDINNGVGPHVSALVFGHCTWSPSQLQHEVDNDAWLVSEYNEELMFPNDSSGDDIWNNAIDFHIDSKTNSIIEKI